MSNFKSNRSRQILSKYQFSYETNCTKPTSLGGISSSRPNGNGIQTLFKRIHFITVLKS